MEGCWETHRTIAGGSSMETSSRIGIFNVAVSNRCCVFLFFQRVIDSGTLSWISQSPRRMRIWTMIRCNKVKHLLLSWENPLLRSWVASWEGSVDCLGRAISTADTTEPQVKHSLETPNSESQKKKRYSQRLALTRSEVLQIFASAMLKIDVC